MKTATVQGGTVKIGDYVSFKSDYEQCGKVVDIKTNPWGSAMLVLENENGFGGDYLQYATRTQEMASDCWVE